MFFFSFLDINLSMPVRINLTKLLLISMTSNDFKFRLAKRRSPITWSRSFRSGLLVYRVLVRRVESIGGRRYRRVFDLVASGEGPRITYSLVSALDDVADRDVDPSKKAKDLRRSPRNCEIVDHGIRTVQCKNRGETSRVSLRSFSLFLFFFQAWTGCIVRRNWQNVSFGRATFENAIHDEKRDENESRTIFVCARCKHVRGR